MNTPIADFIRNYAARNPVRLHMPGHKGRELLGCEALDITEIPGADELYVADGIIGESEQNAAGLFGTGATLYSTEGSSQCIRAMVYLAALNARDAHARESVYPCHPQRAQDFSLCAGSDRPGCSLAGIGGNGFVVRLPHHGNRCSARFT